MRKINEDVPQNSMGASSSTSGPIQGYDPIFDLKGLRRRIQAAHTKVLGSLDIDGHDGSAPGDGPTAYDEYQGYHDKA